MRRPFLLPLMLLILTACDNGDIRLLPTPVPEPVAPEINIAASLGLIQGATVRLLTPAGAEIAGATGTLAVNGTVTITHDGTHTGPLIVEVSGNGSALYFDESTGTNLPFGEDQVLRAVVPSIGAESIGVSILTELGAQLAENLGSELSATDVDMINESIRTAFAPDVADILAPPVLVSADNFAQGALEDTDAGRYALRLAALAEMANGSDAPALSILEQLSADLSDGDIDGVSVDGPIAGLLYRSNAFAQDFQQAAVTAAAALADSTLAARTTEVVTTTNLLQSLSDQGVNLPTAITDRISNNLPSGNFDLTISGSVTTAGIDVPFAVSLGGVPAPSPTDSEAISSEVEATVAGLSNLTNLEITVVTNTSTQVTFDVTLAASQAGSDVTLALRYDYTLSDSQNAGDGSSAGGDGGGSSSGNGADGNNSSSSGGDSTDSSTGGSACVFGGSSSPATIPASFSASSFELVYGNAQSGSPISEGDRRTFLFSSSGGLFIDDVKVAENPVLCGGNPAEASWLDATAGLVYSVSDLTGSFNEVNVASSSGTFFGQYREGSAEEAGPPAALTALAGTFATQVVESCTGDICPNTTPVGEIVTVIIGDDGTITFGEKMLSTEIEGATFSDNTSGSVQPRFSVTNTGVEDGETYNIEIYIDDGAVVAARLKHTVSCGGGCGQSKDLYSEVSELPAALTDFFDAFIALMPVTLTVVTDDPTYFGKTGQLTGAPFGVAATCRSFEISAAKDVASVPSTRFRPRFSISSDNSGVFDYQRQESRFKTEGGDQILSFNGGQIVLRADGVIELEEGFLDNTVNFVTNVQDLSTTRQATIDTACANYHTISGSLTTMTAGTVTIGLVDTATDTTIDTVFGVISTGEPFPFAFIAESGLSYEVKLISGSPSTLTCAATNGTGTLADSDVTTVALACED